MAIIIQAIEHRTYLNGFILPLIDNEIIVSDAYLTLRPEKFYTKFLNDGINSLLTGDVLQFITVSDNLSKTTKDVWVWSTIYGFTVADSYSFEIIGELLTTVFTDEVEKYIEHKFKIPKNIIVEKDCEHCGRKY